MLRPGDVVYVLASHITPPHNKFYVIVCLQPMVLGFFVNSKINNYIQRRRHLAEAQVRLLQREHPKFLRYDSWLDCSDVHSYTLQYLEREVRTNPPAYLGCLSNAARKEMLRVVGTSYTLAQEHIDWILAAFG